MIIYMYYKKGLVLYTADFTYTIDIFFLEFVISIPCSIMLYVLLYWPPYWPCIGDEEHIIKNCPKFHTERQQLLPI